MLQHLTYYMTLWIIRAKGIKRNFRKEPIDVGNLRKDDVHEPLDVFFKRNIQRIFRVYETKVTEIGNMQKNERLLLFIPGGAFISGPAPHHWDTVKTIAKKTEHTIWLCDYPKAPENNITHISDNIDALYASALTTHSANQITIMGDSVGATLATALIQRLIKNKVALPEKVILVTPVMDASMSNPQIDPIDPLDPMLSKVGVRNAKKMCAGDLDLKHPILSPLYGNFDGFPPTALFLAEHDIMYPDGKLAEMKMKKANIHLIVFEGRRMPHIWPFLPFMTAAKLALDEIIKLLNQHIKPKY